MRNAQQRGALCAHGELRNCLYQRQFVSDTRRKSCLQKNFDEVAHERYARSTAGGALHWCRQEGVAAELRRKGCRVIIRRKGGFVMRLPHLYAGKGK